MREPTAENDRRKQKIINVIKTLAGLAARSATDRTKEREREAGALSSRKLASSWVGLSDQDRSGWTGMERKERMRTGWFLLEFYDVQTVVVVFVVVVVVVVVGSLLVSFAHYRRRTSI